MAAEPIGCAQVFLDRICISSDPELKAQAILSLSGLLKKLLGYTRGFQAFLAAKIAQFVFCKCRVAFLWSYTHMYTLNIYTYIYINIYLYKYIYIYTIYICVFDIHSMQ